MKTTKVVAVEVYSSRCPYCREELAVDVRSLVRCSRCSTYSHADCFEESQSCSVYGCKGTSTTAPVRAPRILCIKQREQDNYREHLWMPLWIIVYTICLCAYLSLN
jgi:hypothetical protein